MNWKQAFTLGLLAPGVWDGKVAEQWETLFEGEVTTTETSYNGSQGYLTSDTSAFFADGDIIRITANGVSETATAVTLHNTSTLTYTYAGNQWLEGVGNAYIEDNGGDFLAICNKAVTTMGKYVLILYTRNPGTYTIKVERRIAKKYNFNGVILPALPETKHPYAMMARSDWDAVVNGTYSASVYFMSEPAIYTGLFNGGALALGNVQKYQLVSDERLFEYRDLCGISDAVTEVNKWIKVEEATYTEEDQQGYRFGPTWSNHNILKRDDGTVYHEASTPVPVYE